MPRIHEDTNHCIKRIIIEMIVSTSNMYSAYIYIEYVYIYMCLPPVVIVQVNQTALEENEW